jgi:hypothetical protein
MSTQSSRAHGLRHFVTETIDRYLRALGIQGVATIVMLVFLALAFLWAWEAKEWRGYISATAAGLGTFLAATAAFSEKGEIRWGFSFAGAMFTAWVAWYSNSDLAEQLKEKSRRVDALNERLIITKKDVQHFATLVPKDAIGRILQDAGWEARSRFNETVEKTDFNKDDLDSSKDLLEFIKSIDSENGHYLYISAEIARKLGDRSAGRADLYAYLNRQEAFYPQARQGEYGPCRNPDGFCRERTAWVFHLLANDFYQEGLAQKTAKKALAGYYSTWSEALKYACTAMTLFRGEGFNDPKQLTPTSEIAETVGRALGRSCPAKAATNQ